MVDETVSLTLDHELRSAAQLKMLQTLARRLNQLNDVTQIAEAITAELRTLVDYHNCRVYLIQADGETLAPIAWRGHLSEYMDETFDALVMRVGEGITGHVAQTGESVLTADAAASEYAQQIPGTDPIDESMLVVPLRYGTNVIGTVALSKLGIGQFDEEDVRVLEVLAAHAAVAIENARLLERERAEAVASRELLKLSQALTQVHDIEGVLAETTEAIPALIRCADVQVFLRRPENGGFRMVPNQRRPVAQLQQTAEPLEIPAAVAEPYVASVEEPFIIPRAVAETVPLQYRFYEQVEDVLVAPIRWEPNGLGMIVLVALADGHFSERDIELSQGIADITSLALGNASRFQELAETAKQLLALDEMKNTFLDAVSHELRTPLATVLGIALTLQREDLELSVEDSRDLLWRLATNARKLDRLLSDLLDLDRLARGIMEPNRRPTDVGALVQAVVEGSELLTDRVVHLDTPSVVVDVDAAKVERIVENLMVNTVRHTPLGTEIWVRVRRIKDGVLMVVEDAGSGVPEDLRHAIFEPFRQGETARHSPGVGIGLSLVARFSELHGGRAWVEERPGGGASFKVFLPGAGPRVPRASA